MTDEILFDLKKIDEYAERIVLCGIPVRVYREASTKRNEERDEVKRLIVKHRFCYACSYLCFFRLCFYSTNGNLRFLADFYLLPVTRMTSWRCAAISKQPDFFYLELYISDVY